MAADGGPARSGPGGYVTTDAAGWQTLSTSSRMSGGGGSTCRRCRLNVYGRRMANRYRRGLIM
jgi:hypothetical protein